MEKHKHFASKDLWPHFYRLKCIAIKVGKSATYGCSRSYFLPVHWQDIEDKA